MKIYPRHQLDISISDFCAAIVSYFTPLDRPRLKEEILAFWQDREHVTLSFSVRTAFDSLLSAMDFPKGSEVLMSAINITDMVKIVEHHHLKVVPVDVQVHDMSVLPNNLETAISANAKIFVFAQLFGAIVDLTPLAAICKKRGILLIEDCSQAFCGSTYHGSPHADISFFSFGTIKSSTALGGAIVVSKTREYIQAIEFVESGYRIKGEFWFLARIVKYLLLKLALSPRVYWLLLGILTLFRYDLEHAVNTLSKSFPHGPLLPQIRFQPPLHLLFLLRKRLQANDDRKFEFREQETRRFLKKLGDAIMIPSLNARYHSFWVLPLLTNEPKRLQNKLLQNGFDSTQAKHSQTLITASNRRLHPVNAACILDNVVYLPTITAIVRADQEKLIALLNANIAEMGPIKETFDEKAC